MAEVITKNVRDKILLTEKGDVIIAGYVSGGKVWDSLESAKENCKLSRGIEKVYYMFWDYTDHCYYAFQVWTNVSPNKYTS